MRVMRETKIITEWRLRHMLDVCKKLAAAKDDKKKKKLLEQLGIDYYSFEEFVEVLKALMVRMEKANERVKAAQAKKRSGN